MRAAVLFPVYFSISLIRMSPSTSKYASYHFLLSVIILHNIVVINNIFSRYIFPTMTTISGDDTVQVDVAVIILFILHHMRL